MTPRMANTHLSNTAMRRRTILAAATAPLEPGINELKKRWSPPPKCNQGVIMAAMVELESGEFISMAIDAAGDGGRKKGDKVHGSVQWRRLGTDNIDSLT